MKLRKVLLLVGSLMAASSSMAIQAYNYYPNYPYNDGTMGVSPYIGGMAGLTNYTGTVYYSDGSQDSSTQSGAIGFAGQVGMMFNQFFGVELGYIQYGQLRSTNSLGQTETDYFTAPVIDLKGVLPFGNGFNLFGKLGFASMTSHSTLSSFNNQNYSGLNLGIGGGYYFTPNVEALIQYYATSINTRANTTFMPSIFGFGLNFHF